MALAEWGRAFVEDWTFQAWLYRIWVSPSLFADVWCLTWLLIQCVVWEHCATSQRANRVAMAQTDELWVALLASRGAVNSGILMFEGQSRGDMLKQSKAAACARNYLQYLAAYCLNLQ